MRQVIVLVSRIMFSLHCPCVVDRTCRSDDTGCNNSAEHLMLIIIRKTKSF